MVLAWTGLVRVLVVGNGEVASRMVDLGHEVLDAFRDHPDLCCPGVPFDLAALWPRLHPAPDLVLVVDTLGPQAFAYNLAAVPAPCVYWAVDAHVNWFWQRHYAALFDLVLLAQPAIVPLAQSDGLPARWLPWGVDERVFRDHGLPRAHDVVFVGSVHPHLRPKRAALVELLEQHFACVVAGTSGAARLGWQELARLYSAAKIVVNESSFGDLTFRVFEAMACGAFLLSERTHDGVETLFTPGEHLDLFGPEDVTERVAHWLSRDHERTAVAARGTSLVRSRHTQRDRAGELLALTAGLSRRTIDPTADRAALHTGLAMQLATVRGLLHPARALPLAATHLHAALQQGEAAAAVGLAEVLLVTERPRDALGYLAEAQRLDPSHLQAWTAAAELSRRLGEPAAPLLQAGIAQAPDVGPATRARARAAVARDADGPDARAAVAAVMQEAGTPLQAGLVSRFEADLPRSAFDHDQAVLDAVPLHRGAAEHAADILELSGLRGMASSFRRRVVDGAPADPVARERLASCLRASYCPAAAAHEERVARALRGEDVPGPPEARARAAREAGVALRAAGCLAEAQAALAIALDAQPDDAELLGDLALARLDAGDASGALELLERALARSGDAEPLLVELAALVRVQVAPASR